VFAFITGAADYIAFTIAVSCVHIALEIPILYAIGLAVTVNASNDWIETKSQRKTFVALLSSHASDYHFIIGK
jgi:hypothetical protein